MDRWRRSLSCMALSLCAAAAGADSDEAWLRRADVPGDVRPLLVLQVDTSAAMAEPVEALPPFDPARDYAAGNPGSACQGDRIYWRRGPGPAPACDSTRWVSTAPVAAGRGWRCEAGRTALETTGLFVVARAAQWEARDGGGYWRELRAGDDAAVECRGDRGVHGAATGSWYAADGADGPWSPDALHEPAWDAPPLSDAYVFYTGNFLNYLAGGERITATRYQWLAQRIHAAARSAGGLDIALARTSHDGLGGDDDGRGGMIVLAPAALPEAAASLDALLEAWTPAGPAPLGESLGEVGRWLAGGTVRDGIDSHASPGVPLPSTPEVRMPGDPARYRSPFTHACRAVLLGVATAGVPSADAGAADAFAEIGGSNAAANGCAGNCLARLARALATQDLAPSLPGLQRTALRFAVPPTASATVLEAARAAGHAAADLDDPLAIVSLVAQALQNDAAVGTDQRISAAGLESAAFVTADTSVYYGLSRAVPLPPWPGNLRRYRLSAGSGPTLPAVVLGRDDAPVFDIVSGRLRTASWSEWATQPDGGDVALGGAAGRLPDATARRVYVDLTDAPLTAADNRLTAANPLLTRELLGLDATDPRTTAEVVDWALDRDVFDDDLDQDRDEMRGHVGDPGLRAPEVLRYTPDGPGLALVATADGLLQAFDADSGVERWAFLPRAMLPLLAGLSGSFATAARPHGLDGGITLHLDDADGDGRIVAAAGDEAWLFFGLGRGGTGYYGLDVSDPDVPRLMWSLSPAELPGFGQSWPAPVLARMRLDPADGPAGRRVVLLAGGFDPLEDAAAVPSASRGGVLAIVDAGSGRLLWQAGGPSVPGSDLTVAAMTRSTPSAPRVLDSDGDGLADRAYLLDVAGRLFRFDFPASSGAAGISVTLVAALTDDTEPARSRRFFATPDVVYEQRNGSPQLVLAFGSGWMSRPRALSPEDRFFALFDSVAGPPPATPLAERDLADVTDPPHAAPPQARGWVLRLVAHGAGEKTAGASLTFDHRLRFLTYQPRPPVADAPCGPPAGISRLYTLDVRSGRPVSWAGDRPVPPEEIPASGLPPGLRIAFPPAPPADACDGACTPAPSGLLGGQSLALDFANDPVRTSWRQLDATAE